MKTLVVYESHHGFTERCLTLLEAEVGADLDRWPVDRRAGTPDWHTYGAIVFGGPVYFGRWAPRVVRLIGRHATDLASHPRLGAFVCSLSPKADARRYFGLGLPLRLKGRLGHVAFFGGGLTWKSLGWWEKLLVRQARGIETDASNLDFAAIQGLATWLTEAGSAKPAQP